MTCRIFTTSNCARPNHLLNATSQGQFFLLFTQFIPQFPDSQRCLQLTIFNFSENVQSIFDLKLQKHGVNEKNALGEQQFGNKEFEGTFCC